MFILDYIKNTLDNISNTIRYYNAINELYSLTDRELHDLGLNRYEIPYVVYNSVNK